MMASSRSLSTLDQARDERSVLKALGRDDCDVNARNGKGDTAIHVFVAGGRYECLMALLVNSELGVLDVNASTSDEHKTALHIAVQNDDVHCIQALLAFGADFNCTDSFGMTPLQIALDKSIESPIVALLTTLGAVDGSEKQPKNTYWWQQNVRDEVDGDLDTKKDEACAPVRLKKHEGGPLKLEMKAILQEKLSNLSLTGIPMSRDKILEAILRGNEETQSGLTPPVFHLKGNQCVLCLDGGGIRGLIQIEILMQIEEITRKKITDLFDWIVGTSTGGIVALALVYAKMTLRELRKLYFEMKREVFSTMRCGFGCDEEKMDRLLQKYFGKIRMDEEVPSKVLITAVNATDTDLDLIFFNNCFNDKYSKELVWKVARYTSSCPGVFQPKDGFVDGGVKAMNPSEYALTRIQEYLNEVEPQQEVACLLSVGCGVYQPEKFSDFNPQKYLFAGQHWKKPWKLFHEVYELIGFMTKALLDTEGPGRNCRSRCEKQSIVFYRFNPLLDESVELHEQNERKLCELIMKARLLLQSSKDTDFEYLIQVLRLLKKN